MERGREGKGEGEERKEEVRENRDSGGGDEEKKKDDERGRTFFFSSPLANVVEVKFSLSYNDIFRGALETRSARSAPRFRSRTAYI